MNNSHSYFDRFISLCLGILVGATALYIAVRLIEAIWIALLVTLGVAGFIALAIAVLRSSRNGW